MSIKSICATWVTLNTTIIFKFNYDLSLFEANLTLTITAVICVHSDALIL